MRIIFAGTPEFARVQLEALVNAHYTPIAVYTQPDKPKGRGRKLAPSATKAFAIDSDIPVFQPKSLKTLSAQKEFAHLNPDLMIVAAYGLILPLEVLRTPRYGCLNVHASILPRWRGAAPITRAILAGDRTSGITLMHMDEGLDTGDILDMAMLEMTPEETSASLEHKLAQLGAQRLIHYLTHWDQRKAPIPQDHAASCYAPKIHKQEAEIDWHQDAKVIERQIRAFDPRPGAFTPFQGMHLKIWHAQAIASNADDPDLKPGTILHASPSGIEVHTPNGILNILRCQLPGKKPLSVNELLNSKKDLFAKGQCFGHPDENT